MFVGFSNSSLRVGSCIFFLFEKVFVTREIVERESARGFAKIRCKLMVFFCETG